MACILCLGGRRAGGAAAAVAAAPWQAVQHQSISFTFDSVEAIPCLYSTYWEKFQRITLIMHNQISMKIVKQLH